MKFFSVEDQIVTILDFAGPTVSVATFDSALLV